MVDPRFSRKEPGHGIHFAELLNGRAEWGRVGRNIPAPDSTGKDVAGDESG